VVGEVDARADADREVLKSSLISGMPAAVAGRMRAGLARYSNSKGASKKAAATVREYRSVICAGSKFVSAMRKA
jgi:hypothetical protein